MDIDEIRESFEFFDDWEDKYRFVIDLGRELPALPADARIEENLVRGCQSQVWMTSGVDPEGRLHFELDSDAHIVRGLIAIVLAAVNDHRPGEILAIDLEELFTALELLQHLSQTRGNGLRAMIGRIRATAKAETDRTNGAA